MEHGNIEHNPTNGTEILLFLLPGAVELTTKRIEDGSSKFCPVLALYNTVSTLIFSCTYYITAHTSKCRWLVRLQGPFIKVSHIKMIKRCTNLLNYSYFLHGNDDFTSDVVF